MKKNLYDLYVSIGAACSCTSTLRAGNLQFFSYPFDWVSGSTLSERVELISRDFDGFFNKEDLEYLQTNEEPYNKDVYVNKKSGIQFVHDFPSHSDFDEYYPKVKEKYDRRIARLTKQIEGADRVLFVYIELPYKDEETSDEKLKDSIELLEKRFPDTKVNILYIFNVKDVDFKNRQIVKVSDKVTKIKFDYDKYNKELPYEVNVNKLLKVFREYRISDKYVTLKNKTDILKKKISLLVKNIFSVRNEYIGEIKIKELTVFGLKMRFKH